MIDNPEEFKEYMDYKFKVLFWNLVAILGLQISILIAKFAIFWQLYQQTRLIIRILREQVIQHIQHDQTHSKLDRGTVQLQKEVAQVPEKVVEKIVKETPSAGDGDLPIPPFPYPH